MAVYKNTASQKVACFAYNVVTGLPVTGDAGNITAQISKDGAATAATNDVNPTELDATDAPGVYLFDLTQAETNGDLVVISPVSSTSNVVIEPLVIHTFDNGNILEVALTEAYATDGSAFTLSQFCYQIWSLLAEKDISSVTMTTKKLDGSTTAMTFTLDDDTNPTSITRAS